MRCSINIPLVVKNVKLTGPAGSISVDMILDTGAGISAVNWLHLKIIGYDPAANGSYSTGMQRPSDLNEHEFTLRNCRTPECR